MKRYAHFVVADGRIKQLWYCEEEAAAASCAAGEDFIEVPDGPTLDATHYVLERVLLVRPTPLPT